MLSARYFSSQQETDLKHQSQQSGHEIANNTVAFATDFFPFATKISGEVANLKFAFTLIRSFKTKGLAVATFAATFSCREFSFNLKIV